MNPETQAAYLVCETCQVPTRHTYVQTTPVRSEYLAGLHVVNHLGPVAKVHWFGCSECRRQRIWGVDNAEG